MAPEEEGVVASDDPGASPVEPACNPVLTPQTSVRRFRYAVARSAGLGRCLVPVNDR